MPRYVLIIEYDGRNFCGWQVQPNQISIQGVLQNKLSEFLKTPVKMCGASRTDAGVSARHQVCHIDLQQKYPIKWIQSVPLWEYPISIKHVYLVSNAFHAQHAVISKTYSYTVLLQQHRPIMDYGWWIKGKLDIDNVKIASKSFKGYHDFTSFRSIHCVNNPMRELNELQIIISNESHIKFIFKAAGFLMHQIRIIVGTLIDIGFGRFEPNIIPAMFAAKNRCAAGQTAPADGLVLEIIEYPDGVFTENNGIC